ncbi:TDRD1 [Branchiostoma lanceolatum]|uniref:TDRD1 protein n=1 Tax=Branchiostoma lanceolatum TaxID=7740 RepID=A0A8J9ZM63_BRALA|nr:TDRD1 [Branchiostoma lanceolatum]
MSGKDLDVLGSWNPMEEDYTSPTFNSYDRGPGANFPNGLAPASRNSGDGEKPQSDSITLYVSGIPLEMEADGVKHFFGQVAVPKSVDIKRPKDFSYGSTYCFVDMASVRDADAVMREFHLKKCGSFTLKIRPAKPKREFQESCPSEKVQLYASQGQSPRNYSSSDSGSQRESRPPMRTIENRYGKISPSAPDRDLRGRHHSSGGDSPPPLDDRPPSPIKRSYSSGRLDTAGPASAPFTNKYSQFKGSMAGQERSPHHLPAVPDTSGRRQSLSPHNTPYAGQQGVGGGVRRSVSQSNIRDRQLSGEFKHGSLADRGYNRDDRVSPSQQAPNFERAGQPTGARINPSLPDKRGGDRTEARIPTPQGTYTNGTHEGSGDSRQTGASPKPSTSQHPVSPQKTGASSDEHPALPCLLCGQHGKSRCGRCKKPYCSKECQKKHWPEHRSHCRAVEHGEDVLSGFENFDVSAGEDVKEKMDTLMALSGIQMPTATPPPQQQQRPQPSPSPPQAAPPPELTLANMVQAKLPKGETVKVSVTEVVSPENISVQIVHHETILELHQLMVNMAQTYEGTTNDGSNAYHPQAGELCAAKFSDGGWYRAGVDGVNPDGTLAVSYVDFGNSETITVARVRKLDPEMAKLPLLAVKCSLLALADKGGSAWSAEVLNFLKTNIVNKECSVIMKEEQDGTTLVEMAAVDTGKSVAEMVLESGLFVPCQKPPPPPKDPQEDFGFLITHIDSPASFYGQVGLGADMKAVAEDLGKKMELIAGLPAAVSQNKQEPYMPQVGELCCALWEMDQMWYRAEVVEVVSNSQLKVFFLDYGNTETVTTANTRPIPESFTECPALALHCKLAGVSPVNSDRWSHKVTAFFKDLTKDKLLMGTPIAREGVSLSVELKDFATGVRVSEEMVQAGAAVFSPPAQSHAVAPAATPASAAQHSSVSPGKPAGDSSRPPSSQLHRRSPTPPVHSSPASSPSPQPPELQPRPQTRPGSAKKSREQTVSRVQPPTSGRFDVVLKCVRSPGLFYCQLTEPSGVQELQMLLKEITHHCQGQPMDPTYYPDIGEICCVNSPDGRNWLRAQVQEHRISNKVQIECVDIGKQVQVSPTRLRPALPQHTVLPLQVFKASLAGVVPVHGGEWSKGAAALLSSYVDSQRLTAEVVGQEGDRYFLDLWDCSSKPERSLSVMLAEEGLAQLEPQSPEGSPPPSRKLSQKSSQPPATHPPPVQNGHVLSPSPVEVIQNGGLERASSHKAPPAAAVGTAGSADLLSVLRPELQEIKDMIAKQQQQLSSVCSLLEQLLHEKRS